MNRQDTQLQVQQLPMLKQLKKMNDRLNNLIGVASPAEIAKVVRRDQQQAEALTSKISHFIRAMQTKYVDPAASRRMGTLKQQFRIQNDRRNNLLSSIKSQQTTRKEQTGDSKAGWSNSTCGLRQSENETTKNSMLSDQLSKEQNLNIRIDYNANTSSKQQNDLNQHLVHQQDLNKSQKSKILSYLQSKRKKISYFLIFTLVKIGVWMIFFN